MKLTIEDIRNITVGTVNVWQEENIFYFAKCTERQSVEWLKLGENLGPRSRTTTGVRLDFCTDSRNVVFEVNSGDRFEIYVDNMMKNYWSSVNVEEDITDLKANIQLDGTNHRVTLYFPSHSVGTLKYVEIDDGAIVQPYEHKMKMMFYGDSITQGWNSKWDSLSFANIVSRHFDANSIIQGIGGAIFHENTFDETIEYSPDVVCVAYGTNDWGYYQTMEEGRMHCASFLDKLVSKYDGKKIFAISPIWRGDTDEVRPMGDFDKWCDVVKEEIVKRGIILIDGAKMVPNMPEFFDDGFLHPHDLGFAIYAENLIKEMEDKI